MGFLRLVALTGFFLFTSVLLAQADLRNKLTLRVELAPPEGGAALGKQRDATLVIGEKITAAAQDDPGDDILNQLPPLIFNFKEMDIGQGKGTSVFSNGGWVITAQGDDIWNKADNFRGVFVPVVGDFVITCRMHSINADDNWAKAGLMIRDSSEAGAANAIMACTMGEVFTFQTRGKANEDTGMKPYSKAKMPSLLRLQRIGDEIKGYVLEPGRPWTLVGSATIKMDPPDLLGLAMCSHNGGRKGTGRFEAIAGRGQLQPQGSMIQFTEPSCEVTESSKSVKLTVERLGTAGEPVTTAWYVRGGSAKEGKDFIAPGGELSWGANETAAKEIVIPIVDNADAGRDLEFRIGIRQPKSGARLGSNAEIGITIIDDDGPGQVVFKSPIYSVEHRAKDAQITVLRQGGKKGRISVVCKTHAGSARPNVNYKEQEQTLVWNDGDLSPKTLVIPMVWPEIAMEGDGEGKAVTGLLADSPKKDEAKKDEPKKAPTKVVDEDE